MKGFRVSGSPAALSVALEQIHVATEVRGVLIEETEIEVYVDGDLPLLSGVTVLALSVPTAWPSGREHDVPIRIGESILVRPPWVDSPPGFEGIELVVPREMAFGSGEHASTRAALAILEQVLGDSVQSLADVGTGSGILALYARARGCGDIAACDIEDASVRAAAELLPDAQVVRGGPSAIHGQFDCVVANMRSAEILECLSEILGLWTRRGPLVLSGLRELEVAPLIGEVALPVRLRITDGDFSALAFVPGIQSPSAT